MKIYKSLSLFILLNLWLVACAGSAMPVSPDYQPAGQPISQANVIPTVTSSPLPTATPNAVVEETNITEEAGALLWQGPSLTGESGCQSLRLTADNQAMIGPCGAEGTSIEFFADQPGGWAEMVARFAPFQAETGDERIDFQGRGQIASPAWQRAITTWARFTQAELAAGRAGAANRTVLSWWLGEASEQPGLCRHLVVLNHGYAYRSLSPCEGGQDRDMVTGWLEIEAWEQFDTWLYNRATVYQDNNYFSGQGSGEMNEDEVMVLSQWAEVAYERLSTGSDATESQPNESNSAAGCPDLAAGTQFLANEALGYCLLYPTEYTAVQSTPNTMELVVGSVMNHVDPRASITVEDVMDRTLAQVAEQLEADYTIPGMETARETITIDGVEAVVLDNLPGQDLNRRVAFIHDERLFSLFFTPVDESLGDTYVQMEKLYTTVINSFKFVPE